MKRTIAARTAALLLAVPLGLTACSGGDVDGDVDGDGGNVNVEVPEGEVPDVDVDQGTE